MKIVSSVVLCVTCMAVLCMGCQSTPARPGGTVDEVLEGLVPPLVQNALASPCFAGGKRPVMAISRIRNETMMMRGACFDIMQARMTEMFLGSGKVDIVATPDELLNKSAVAPSLVLHGRLLQRTILKEGDQKQVEFILLLSIVDVNSGVLVWNGERKAVCLCDAYVPTR